MKPAEKIGLTILAVFLCCLSLSLVHAGTAYADTNSAIDNNGPQKNSGTSGVTNFTPLTGVGQGAFNGQVMWYKVYVQNGLPADITVTPTCNDRVGTPTVDYSMDVLSPAEHDYDPGNVYGAHFPNGTYTIENDTNSCSTPFSFHIPKYVGVSSQILGHEGYRVFGFYAQIEPLYVNKKPVNQEQYFRVQSLSSPAKNNQAGDTYIGLSKPDITNLTVAGKALKYATFYKTSGTWDAEVMFAPACFQDVSGTQRIQIFDADNGPVPPGYQTNMHADLLESTGNPPPWTTVKTWNRFVVQDATTTYNTSDPNWGKSGTTGNLDYSFYKTGYVYKLEIIGAAHPNTIQIKLPFDQFDAKISVQNECNVSCSIISPANGSTIPVNQDTSVKIKGAPGSDPWDIDGGTLYIKRIGSTDSEANYASLQGSNPYIDTVHPPPGTTSVTYNYGIYYWQVGNGGYTGIHCPVTYTVAPPPNVTCNVGAKTLPPGQPDPQMYTVNITVTGVGGNYSVMLTAIPGAYVTGPNPQTVTLPANPVNYVVPPIHFGGHIDYQGSFAVSITDPFGNPVTLNPACTGNAAPAVSPYFQVWQNDVAAGGGFNNVDTCPNSYPGYVSPATVAAAPGPPWNSGNYKYAGGIIANSSTTSPPDKQSLSDFGAEALGLIPVPAGTNVGFYAGYGTAPGPGGLRAWFANDMGGVPTQGWLDPSSANANYCAPDFYTKTVINPAGISSLTSEPDVQTAVNDCLADLTANGRCQYVLNHLLPTNLSGPMNIPVGMQLTLYAAGNITIAGNIYYVDSSHTGAQNVKFDPTNMNSAPYFALLTQGNVYVTNSATELDGLYVVQPSTPGGAGGTFATCDPGNQCNNQLVVNGAVIAQQVVPLRAHGAIENGVPASIGNEPAEIFNFVPSMVLGAPAFNPICLPGSCAQGAYSIAPVF